MRILLAGGGTAGHTSPLLATADALRRLDPEVESELAELTGGGKLEDVLRGPPRGLPAVGDVRPQALLLRLVGEERVRREGRGHPREARVTVGLAGGAGSGVGLEELGEA